MLQEERRKDVILTNPSLGRFVRQKKFPRFFEPCQVQLSTPLAQEGIGCRLGGLFRTQFMSAYAVRNVPHVIMRLPVPTLQVVQGTSNSVHDKFDQSNTEY